MVLLLLLLLCFAAVCARAAEGPALHAAEPHAASAAAAPRLLPVTSPVSLDWAGRSWSVKTGVALPGPGAGSHYEPSHAWVDAAGGLHLKVAPSPGAAGCSAWSSAEVWTNAPLGYGTYEVQFTAPRFLDPFTTFGCGCRSAPAPAPCPLRPALTPARAPFTPPPPLQALHLGR
jgi:hypothetical protein